MPPTIGKIHGLQRCASPKGTFTILALDHRGNLKRSFSPGSPQSVPYQQIVDFKCQLTSILSPHADGILLDPEFGAAQVIAGGDLHPGTGLLVAVEETGYAGDPTERQSQVLPGWGVEKIARMGAAGAKLLVYFHPDAPNAADQVWLVSEVAGECQKYDLPLFLEPLSYSLDPAVKALDSQDKRRVVVETARQLTPLGVDVLKAEFPLDIRQEPHEATWMEACRELSDASTVPWVLLSAGVGFEDFLRQAEIACQAGASGVLAGRAVWKEAVGLTGEARKAFLETTAVERLSRLKGVVEGYARSWRAFYPDLGESASEGWYARY